MVFIMYWFVYCGILDFTPTGFYVDYLALPQDLITKKDTPESCTVYSVHCTLVDSCEYWNT